MPIGAVAGQATSTPTNVPAEAILESEPVDWWTAGRRVRIGRLAAAAARAGGIEIPPAQANGLEALPAPCGALEGTDPDGREHWELRTALGLDEAWFREPGPPRQEPVDLWDPAELSYSAELCRPVTAPPPSAGTTGVTWTGFHADATAEPGPGGRTDTVRTIPERLRYPSAPLASWWRSRTRRSGSVGTRPTGRGWPRSSSSTWSSTTDTGSRSRSPLTPIFAQRVRPHVLAQVYSKWSRRPPHQGTVVVGGDVGLA